MAVIDLSIPIRSGMPVYPGDPEVEVRIVRTRESHGWELRQMTLGTHTGTHVDAFSHMHAGGTPIDRMPLERFFGKAQVVRPDGAWPRDGGLFFKEEIGVGLFEGLARLRPPFVGGELTEELERALLGAGIVTYTSLANLERLPEETDFMFYGFPLAIENGDGSPVRAVAVL
ncbi:MULTISPECIES: cyclase family protein [Cohnella]|uniref:cyclase family protein n=1 Tax=Cohnella TaxID=329857 RepID=UPI0009BB04E8|nr:MULTISPECIES: cyclase family protein [Cohnella]MBN2984215.1 cyclase family protein [Cohnella algarum]